MSYLYFLAGGQLHDVFIMFSTLLKSMVDLGEVNRFCGGMALLHKMLLRFTENNGTVKRISSDIVALLKGIGSSILGVIHLLDEHNQALYACT